MTTFLRLRIPNVNYGLRTIMIQVDLVRYVLSERYRTMRSVRMQDKTFIVKETET